jgi:hypothetical protein
MINRLTKHLSMSDADYKWRIDRAEANRLAALPASGQCVHGRAVLKEMGQCWHRDDSSICYGGQAEVKRGISGHQGCDVLDKL